MAVSVRARLEELMTYRNHVRIGIGKDRSGLADTSIPVEFQPELTRFVDAPPGYFPGSMQPRRG